MSMKTINLSLNLIQFIFILHFRLSIRNVAYIGLRSVDRYERLVLEKFGITAFGMEDVERYGNIFYNFESFLFKWFMGIHLTC